MKVQISGEGAYIVSASRREFRGSKPHWPNDLPLGVVRQDGSIYVEAAPYGTQTRGNKPPPGWHDEAARLLNSPAARSAILAGLKKYRRETKKTGLHVARLSDGRRNAFSTSTQAVAWGLQKLKRMPAGSAMGLFHGGSGASVYRDAPHAVYAVTEYGHIEHSPLTNWAKAVAKHESGGNPKVKAKGGRILAFHVYAPDGFESGHATFEGARRAAKRASERSGVEMKVYRTSASGFTGVGHGTEVATFVGLGRGARHESGGNPRTTRQPGRSQEEHFTHPHAKSAGADETMLNLLYGPNPITDDELRKLIAKRPHVYGKYAVYLGKRGQGAKHESGGNPRTTRRPARSQEEHFTHPHAKSAGADETMLNLLYGPNPITDDELRKLIAKRPHVYGKYAAYLGKRGQGAKHESGGNPSVSGRVSPRRAAVIERSYQAIEKAREAHDPKRFKRGGSYSVEEQRAIARAAGLKKAPSNVALGRLELHRFTTERPAHLFAYYKGDSPKSGEAITNFTGEKLGHVVSTGSIYKTGSGYPRTRMLPVRVRAITGDVYSGVANLDTGTYVKLKKVGGKASAAKHESGGNPRTTASDMALKAKVKALVGRGKKS